jgi:hypothetical protein
MKKPNSAILFAKHLVSGENHGFLAFVFAFFVGVIVSVTQSDTKNLIACSTTMSFALVTKFIQWKSKSKQTGTNRFSITIN